MPSAVVGQPVPREVADAVVLGPDGQNVRLGSLWERSACLLVFVRHFGCVGCAEQVTELSPRLSELVRTGVRVVLVGNGSLDQRAAFVERHALSGAPVDVMTDPGRSAYRALGLVRSTWATLGPRALVDLARAMSAGYPHRAVEGDATQQGGGLLVDAAGVVRLAWRSRSIGDHPAASDLVEAAWKLAIETRSVAVRV